MRLHFLQQLLPEFLAPEEPTPLERFPFLGILVPSLAPPLFHSLLELRPAGSSVFLNSVLAQQPIHAQPAGAMARRCQIGTEAAPWIFQQALLRGKQLGPYRIQMHVVTGRPQVACGAAFNDEGFVTPTEDVPEKLLPVIEANGVSAQQPAHSRDQVGAGG